MLLNNPDHDSKRYYESFSLSPCVILLNGFPGVGKLTIAKALKAKLELDNTPHRLIDNHLLIDPVVAIEPIRNRDHYALRKSFRKIALEGLKALKDQRLVIIFTAALSTLYLPTPYDDIDQFTEYVHLAEARGVTLFLVNIECDFVTNGGRLCGYDRKEVGGKTKLVDVDVLERVRRETLTLDREQAMACGKEGRIFSFELDTSELSVEHAAEKVWEFLTSISI